MAADAEIGAAGFAQRKKSEVERMSPERAASAGLRGNERPLANGAHFNRLPRVPLSENAAFIEVNYS